MCALLTALLMVGAPSALAATCGDTWMAKSGNWNTGSDWSTGKAPTSSEVACITEKGTYTVTLEPSSSAYVYVGGLQVGGPSGTQTLKVVATGATSGAYLSSYGEVSVEPHGVVELTSSGGEYESRLGAESGQTVTNAGTISAEKGAGGARGLGGTVSNTGTVAIADAVALGIYSGHPFTDAKGGVVAGAGSGHLLVAGGQTYVQGAGKTEGIEPVVAENGGYLEYTGGGESHVFVRDANDAYLKGAIAKNQTLTVEGNCASPYRYARLYVLEDASNAGRIALTTSGCGEEAMLEVPSGKTLTTTGTIELAAGTGGVGAVRGSGTLVNKGTVSALAGASSAVSSSALVNEGLVALADKSVTAVTGTFKNGSGGTVAGSGSGHLQVWDGGTYVQAAGKTEGAEPVVAENGGYLEYAGGGESHVFVRDASDA
ncbi:MAG: hypothetical protein ACLQBB_14465 [Solirubrobacteraceae bacterium]